MQCICSFTSSLSHLENLWNNSCAPEVLTVVEDTTEQKIGKITALIKLTLEKTDNQQVDKYIELMTLASKEEKQSNTTLRL